MTWSLPGLTPERFKRLAKRLHGEMGRRRVSDPSIGQPKLTEVQEILARSLGYRNAHAALTALAQEAAPPGPPPIPTPPVGRISCAPASSVSAGLQPASQPAPIDGNPSTTTIHTSGNTAMTQKSVPLPAAEGAALPAGWFVPSPFPILPARATDERFPSSLDEGTRQSWLQGRAALGFRIPGDLHPIVQFEGPPGSGKEHLAINLVHATIGQKKGLPLKVFVLDPDAAVLFGKTHRLLDEARDVGLRRQIGEAEAEGFAPVLLVSDLGAWGEEDQRALLNHAARVPVVAIRNRQEGEALPRLACEELQQRIATVSVMPRLAPKPAKAAGVRPDSKPKPKTRPRPD